MIHSFKSLGEALKDCGAKVYMNRRQQMVVAKSIPAMPDSGCSFWVTTADELWYIGTWDGRVYCVADDRQVIDVCREFLNVDTNTAPRKVPREIVERYRLRLLSHDEYDWLAKKMYDDASAYPPETEYTRFCDEMRKRGFAVNCFSNECVEVVTTAKPAEVPRRLWFTLFNNHWYVRTPSLRIYGLDDTDVISLCFYALTDKEPVMDTFDESFIDGYQMFEVDRNQRILIKEQFPTCDETNPWPS